MIKNKTDYEIMLNALSRVSGEGKNNGCKLKLNPSRKNGPFEKQSLVLTSPTYKSFTFFEFLNNRLIDFNIFEYEDEEE